MTRKEALLTSSMLGCLTSGDLDAANSLCKIMMPLLSNTLKTPKRKWFHLSKSNLDTQLNSTTDDD